MNNWGGSIVERIANIGSSAGWTQPESFIVGNGYDTGGFLPPGWSMNYNGTGRPEAVLTGDQWDALSKSGVVNNWTVYAKDEPTVDTVMRSWRQWEALQVG